MSQTKIQAALELALDSMVGLIPAVGIASSAAGAATVFSASAPHGLSTGVGIAISGHSSANGVYSVEVVDATKFKARSLSNGSYLSTNVAGTGGQVKANLTEWENVSFTPVVGVPYQQAYVLFADPTTPSFGSTMVREIGFMQISLFYPKQMGTADINARIDLIKSTFKRGATFVKDGIKVIVSGPASVNRLGPMDSVYGKSVRIPFYSDIYS